MALTITIPGAVEATIGATAPAVLTVGVGTPGATGPAGAAGSPGAGVAAGGSTGQVLQKLSATSYDTGWLTLPADYITSVSSPLAVTTGNLTVDLSAYLPISGGTLDVNGTITAATATVNSLFAGDTFGVELSANPSENASLQYNGVQVQNAIGSMLVTASGLTFPNLSTQSIAFPGFNNAALTGNPTAPTPDTSDNDTSIATTAYVKAQAFGDRYLTSSTTSNTISNDNKTFTIGTGLSYTPTQNITISYDASNHMHGEVLTYNSGTGVLTVDINHHTGSGTYASWVVNVGGVTPATSVAFADITGAVSGNTNLQAALDLKANLASPALTGNVTITSNSAGAALFIEQAGAGNILTLHDQASDTNFVAIDANGKVNTITSEATNGAGFNIPHGVAPTTPVNGDIWTTTGGLFARINAGTQQFAALSTNNIFTSATQTLGNSTATGTINVASGATISASTKTVNVATGGVVGSTTTTTIGPVLGASTTSIGGTTAASTLNLATGATLTATTKAVNIGTAGVAGSTTNITIGSTTGTSTTTLQGITNGVTESVDSNNTELATTAFVVGQAGSATPLVNGTAAVGTSLRYARQDHVHGTDTSRAALASPTFTGTPLSTTAAVDTNTTQIATTAYVVGQGYAKLASPTFSGTPSLPTGTTAVTQSPGNNTTALATTAFVLANAGSTSFASTAQVVAATSTTTALAPGNQGFLLTNPRLQTLAFINTSSLSGSGNNTTTNPQNFSRQIYLSSLAVGRAAFSFGAVGVINGGFGTSTAKSDQVDFSKKVWISGYACMGWTGGTSYIGDANTMCRITLGGYSTSTTGDMTLKGIGLKKVGGTSSFVTLTVHNGTTLTDVASSVTVADNAGIHWQIYSDGTGNVTLYINGTQAATTTAGPTTATASGSACYREQVEAAATPGVRQVMNCNGGWFYTE